MDSPTDEPKKASMIEDVNDHDIMNAEVLEDPELMNEAFAAENSEHAMGLWEAAKAHPMACVWAFTFAFTIVMESFCMFLNTNYVALSEFQRQFGVKVSGGYSIPTAWQSALFQSGQCGAFIGVFLAGPITNRIGYRWTTILGLVLLNCTIFIGFFAESLATITIGQAFEGLSWGFFIANSPAYASEVAPIALRGAVTATIQMSWSIGSIIVAAATLGYNTRTDQWAWRAPMALQWLFPTPLLILIFFAPESPWWLTRHGRRESALRSLKRLTKNCTEKQAQEKLAMIERTVEIERNIGGTPNLLDLFRGTDLRRTVIICLIYASQNFAGNLIANQAVFFFEQAGISDDFAFKLGLINSCLQFLANACAWPLTAWFGRRTIYLAGTGFNIVMLFLLAIIASIPQNHGTNYAQACLGVIISFVFAGTQGPISYTIIAETSSVRLRALSTAVGRAAYYLAEIPMIYLASRLLNTTGWNLAGKCGYVWGSTACVCFVMAFFFLPELKHRSYRETDILFNRHIQARKFKSTIIDVKDNE